VLLSDENVIYLKTKKAHWNIRGNDFYDEHKFFEMQIEQLNGITDMFAERIRAIGH
jgi:starvation-inducible DNA-binding protein